MSRVRLLKLLGLQAGATRDEIKSRYRGLARRFHPDVNICDERSHARFRAIVAAYHELVADEAEWVAPPQRVTTADTPPPNEPQRFGNLDGASAAPTRASPPEMPGGGFARQRAELRERIGQREMALHRAQADVRDGDTKALAARRRGDDQMARHFERRVEADRSRVYALLGEISGLERELRGLEAARGGADSQGPAKHILSEAGLDPNERLSREVQKLHDEERAVLKKKYESEGRRRTSSRR